MGELMTFSPSSLLLSRQLQLRSSRSVQLPKIGRILASPICYMPTRQTNFSKSHSVENQRSWRIGTGIVSDSVPSTFTVDSAGGGIDILPDSGSDDNIGGLGGKGGGGGGGGGGNGGNNGNEGDEDQSGGSEKKKGMSMSQKLTLGYAALVGIGGVMGYLKGGSQKSLVAGGVSALLLYFVFTILPTNPVLASSLGLGLSAALLGVMGSRFKKSGKIFPAGIVSFVSLVMTGGYLHGILRSLH